MKCLTLIIGILSFKLIAGNIHSKLHYFETLKAVDVRSRERRSADKSSTTHKEVSFYALGRYFDLLLTPDSNILSNTFKSYVIKADQRAEPFNINRNEFYSGRMTDEEGMVNAHLEDSVWNIQVSTKDDIYALEPSWRHLPPSDNHSLIAYRHSDIKWDNLFPNLSKSNESRHRICEDLHADFPEDELRRNPEQGNDTVNTGHDRQKRQAWLVDKNTCNLIVIADYKFNKGVGGDFKHRTSNYIIGLLQRLEGIYRYTNFDPARGHVGFGFQIKEMRIHDSPTDPGKGKLHYNMKGDPQSEYTWNTRTLLEEFSNNNYFKRFCLAHLFTYQKFSGGVLGLAYIASPRLGTIGGICSPTHKRRNGKWYSLNTGWSSSMNTAGSQMLAQESMLVTAHGHNWGSEHDVDTDECAPSSFNKGKYIMYPYAVSGWEENNRLFSPCSKRYISDVIRAKAFKCFEEKKDNAPYCGNSVVDSNEECDAGSDGDMCCSERCRFIRGATCSPMNYECCENCQMASEDYICRSTSEFSCLETTRCNGTSFDCPPAEPKKGLDIKCLDGGTCRNGVCQSFCQLLDKEPCICNEPENACRRCCKPVNASAAECAVAGGNLIEGRPCYQGFCSKEGICKKVKTELISRFFDFIEKLTPSKFVEIMRSNIVGTVIVLSMIIWVPASWIYSCIDKRKEEEEREHIRNSRFLYFPEERAESRIRVSEVRRIGRPNPSRCRTLSDSTGSIHSGDRETSV